MRVRSVRKASEKGAFLSLAPARRDADDASFLARVLYPSKAMTDPDNAIDVAANLRAVQSKLNAALSEAGRDQGEVSIIAVSKMHDAERIEGALAAGHRIFGENRVQEAAAKWPTLRADYPDIELHLVGPLQSNKSRDAVALFDVIHSIDRPKIARTISEAIEAEGRSPKLLVQINTGEEDQKSGVAPLQADAFVRQCREEFGLSLSGVMCIPPVDQDPAPHFALTEKIARRNGLDWISMGMSGDFETAAQLGATHIRVGSAIFGLRPAPE